MPRAKKDTLPPPEEGMAQIRYRPATISKHLDKVEAELLRKGFEVFQQTGKLTHVVRYSPDNEPPVEYDDEFNVIPPPITRQAGSLTVVEMNPYYLVELMSQAAEWYRFDERKNGWVRYLPALALASHFIGRRHWRLHTIAGLSECPLMRPDGTIVDEDGLDIPTQIYMDKGGIVYPAVKPNPTRQDALDALQVILDLIAGFPFVPDQPDGSSSSRSVALSGFLVGVARKAIKLAPMHILDATVGATGKTMLGDCMAVVATGHTATSITQGPHVEELEKRIHSVLRTGDPVIMIDNVDYPLEGSFLNSILTTVKAKPRILGQSEAPEVDTRSLLLGNGNSIRIKGDLALRTLMCKLDAGMEKPEERKFDRPATDVALENRPALVHACLTILRAYVVAGRPGWRDLTASRFPEWDKLQRGALVWLGQPDPVLSRVHIMAIEPERDSLTTLLQAWEEALGYDTRVTAKELVELVDGENGEAFSEDDGARKKAEALHVAFQGIMPGKTQVSAVSLGRALGRYDRRIVGGRRIKMYPNPSSAAAYTLERVNEISAMPDFGDF